MESAGGAKGPAIAGAASSLGARARAAFIWWIGRRHPHCKSFEAWIWDDSLNENMLPVLSSTHSRLTQPCCGASNYESPTSFLTPGFRRDSPKRASHALVHQVIDDIAATKDHGNANQKRHKKNGHIDSYVCICSCWRKNVPNKSFRSASERDVYWLTTAWRS
jgi:hypothetical protein